MPYNPAATWTKHEVPGYPRNYFFVDQSGHVMTRDEAPPRWVLLDRRGKVTNPTQPFIQVDDQSNALIDPSAYLPIAVIAGIFTLGATLGAAGAASGPELLSGPAVDASVAAAATSSAGTTAAAAATPAVAAAGATSATVGTAATASSAASVANTASTVTDTVHDVTSGIRDLVGSIKETIGPIVGSISSVVHDISSTVQTVNEDLIKPIVGPIKALMDAQKTLSDVLARDLHDGISGILRVPQDIANAFGSVDAALQRSVSMLSANQATNAQLLAKLGLVGADGKNAGDVNSTLHTILAAAPGKFTAPPKFTLEEGPNLEEFKAWAQEQQDQLMNESSLPALFWNWTMRVVGVVEGLAAQRHVYVELWEEEIARAAAIKRFDANTAAKLLARGEITVEAAMDELRTLGFSESRAQALLAANRQLPDTGRILNWFARGYITQNVAEAMLRVEQWDDQQIDTLLQSAYTELGFGDLVELVRRGLLTEDEAQVALQRGGTRERDAAMAMQTRWRLLGFQDLVQLHDRLALSDSAGGFEVLNSPAPEGLIGAGEQLGISQANVAILWANHWRLLSPELAVQAWFRGYINRTQLGQALSASSLPQELHEDFIDLQRPQVGVRQITTLMSQGIITEGDAMDILRARGYTDKDAQHLVSIQKAAAKPVQAAAADHVHGLTQTTILKLFDAGTLAAADARTMLTELGWGDEAIEATLQLHEVNELHDARMAQVDLVQAQAKAGLLTMPEATAALASLDLSASELVKAMASITTAITEHTKMPSVAQVLSMWKHKLLDDAATLDALTLLGYSESWAQLLVELEAAGGNNSAGQNGAA